MKILCKKSCVFENKHFSFFQLLRNVRASNKPHRRSALCAALYLDATYQSNLITCIVHRAIFRIILKRKSLIAETIQRSSNIQHMISTLEYEGNVELLQQILSLKTNGN